MLPKLITPALVLTLVIGVALAAYLIFTNVMPAESPAPAIEFTSVEVGDVVTVAVTARGERVTRAELWAGPELIAREINPNPALVSQSETTNQWAIAWQWQPTAPGVYSLAARAFDEAGKYGASSLFNVVIPPKAKLLFSSNRERTSDGSSIYTLYQIETDTRATGMWQPPMSQNRQPAISSNKVVVFATNQNNAWQLVSRTLEHPALTILTPNFATAQRPTWSEDGKRLAFEVTDANGATNLFVSDANGKNLRALTNSDVYDGQASFDPEGEQLAFTARQGNQSDIYSIALANGQLTRLTTDPAQDAQPAWSPEGARIAFVSNRSGIGQLWVMNADGSNPIQLTNISAGAEQPKWSPDGNWLAFVAYTGAGEGSDRRELYLLYAPSTATNPDQRALIRLTQNDKDDTEPAWVGE